MSRPSVTDGNLGERRPQGLVLKYFVLNPTKKDRYGLASRMAIREYARVIEKTNPKLSKELNDWMNILP